MGLMKPIKQNNGEEINDDKNVRISLVKGRKITAITVSAISARKKLLTTSTNMTLLELDGQDMRVKKIWMEITS